MRSTSTFLTGLWASGFPGILHRRQELQPFSILARRISAVIDDARPKAGVAQFRLGWNQLGIAPSSPAGNREYLFLDFCLGVIFHFFQVDMRDVGQFIGRNDAIDDGRASL